MPRNIKVEYPEVIFCEIFCGVLVGLWQNAERNSERMVLECADGQSGQLEIEMKLPNPSNRLIAIFALSYGVFSLLVSCIDGNQWSSAVLQRNTNLMFFAGPPAALVHGVKFLWFYLVGTLCVFILAMKLFKSKTLSKTIILILMILLMWIFFGWASITAIYV